jgi:hypothetical protein
MYRPMSRPLGESFALQIVKLRVSALQALCVWLGAKAR